MRLALRAVLAALALLGTAAAAPPPVVERVEITGNVRVEEDAIRVHLETQPGAPLDPAVVDRDVRAIYAMGFFDQVRVETAPAAGGRVVVTVRVDERPLIRSVEITGNEKLDRAELEGALKLRPYVILDPEKARQGVAAARKLYADKGYLDAEIRWTTRPVGDNEVDVVYTVSEGRPVRVQRIEFEGNEAFSDRRLRRLLQTSTAWILTPLTGAGNLNRHVLRTDVERLTAFYYDNGYVTVRVDEPRIDRVDDGLVVTIKVDEGRQFAVGQVEIVGENLPADVAELRAELGTKPGDTFRASALRDDVQRLTERLSDDGFAFATVEPDTRIDPDAGVVDVRFAVDRGRPVIVDRIEITGNTKTRDEVIRREMRLQEQELFSGTQLRRSREALQRLGFFQEVNVTTRRGQTADRMNVVVDVKEAQTGAFSAGAGFSSADALLFNVRIQENNLFGRGQRLVFNVDIGSIRRNVILSFTEPYLFGSPLTAGIDAFTWRLRFEDFARTGTGGSLSATYPVSAFGWRSLRGFSLEDVRLGLAYRAERAEISDLESTATTSIRLEEGTTFISSVTPSVSRNTLNHAFDPTAGSLQQFSLEVAGLGGERFLKAEGLGRWYYTFLRSRALGDFTYALGLSGGYGIGDRGLTGDELPLFERYFPGGINSIRGFEVRTLGPRELRKNTRGVIISSAPVGGSVQLIANNEIIFPIVPAIGLKGVLFVDVGNAYAVAEEVSWEETVAAAGGGVRWLSPLGPLRVEVGVPLKDRPRDQKSLVLFSFGGPFQF